jgi:hypothetical protein
MTPAVATTALLAMASVSLWTLRVALTARNHKSMAAVAASVEATVFALAFSRVLSSLDSVVQVAAYATGVGCGTLVGLTINDRLRQPSFDSPLPLWMYSAARVTNENSWRNSDCQFSSVDWRKFPKKSPASTGCPCSRWSSV